MWATRQIPQVDHGSLLRDARDYALLHGLVLRYNHMPNDNCVAHIPFTPFPSAYPKKLYQQCLDLQPVVNKLMVKLANDSNFLNDILGPIGIVDDFTKNLLSINDAVMREGRAQPILCCINRADYMLGKCPLEDSSSTLFGKFKIRQVEVNAIASSMSAHSINTRLLQEFLMSKYNIVTPPGIEFPGNDSLDLVANGLIDAFNSYGKESAQILLVAEERSLNFSDQVLIEIALSRLRPDIRLNRVAFNQLIERLKLGPNKELILDNGKDIGVVYFRYGYDPSQYNFPGAWGLRLLLERSRAIKCPSSNFHLSGAKKFQQVLNSREELERYLTAEEAIKMDQVFCKFWSIESKMESGYKLATQQGSGQLVLKPQREGGGHNIFGKEIKSFVEALASAKDRSQYILMEYIDAPCEQNWLLLHDDKSELDAFRMVNNEQLVSELGIFGSIVADDNSTIYSNKAAGYLIRSKRYGVNEGGVATGYAGISNLMLLDDSAQASLYYDD